MDKKQVKLRLSPETIAKMKLLHPSYGEMSRIVGELIEQYVKLREEEAIVRKAFING